MSETPLTLAQQLALCQQVARLVRSKLPISGELARLADSASGPIGQAATQVDRDISQGKPLAAAIAADPSRNSRMLAACIEIGELSGCLERTLDDWTAMHIARSHYSRKLRAAMVYPSLLILVTMLSLGYVIWHLIPEYRITYAQFGETLPVWLDWLLRIREQLGALLLVMALLAVLPLIVWVVRKKSYAADGLPRETVQRLLVQSLGAGLLSRGIGHGLPLNKAVPLSVAASGGSDRDVSRAFESIQHQALVTQLAREASILLCALYSGVTNPAETSGHLAEVASFLRQQAEDRATRNERWLPMMVAITIGVLTILTYVFLIYLPWILLMQRLGER